MWAGASACGGRQELGQQVEASGLAGPVGPDQRVAATALNLQLDFGDGGETLEFLGQLTGFKNDAAGAHSDAAGWEKKIHQRERLSRANCRVGGRV
jgi:hypothetical protein